LSFAVDFEQKKPFSVLNLRGTNPLRTQFVIRLNEWVHIGQATASASAHCYSEHELAKEKGDFSWKATIWNLFDIVAFDSFCDAGCDLTSVAPL